jgi:hypothetical protein
MKKRYQLMLKEEEEEEKKKLMKLKEARTKKLYPDKTPYLPEEVNRAQEPGPEKEETTAYE